MWPDPQPNAILVNFYPCGSSHTIKWNKPTVMSVRSAMVSWFCVVPISKSLFSKIIQVTIKRDPFDAMYGPCRLHIHLAFTYFVGPSSVVWSKLGPGPPFPPMRVLEVHWLWALSLVAEVALRISFHVGRHAPHSSGDEILHGGIYIFTRIWWAMAYMETNL